MPGGSSTRPTSDRAREGLFGTIMSDVGSLVGRHVLDLYAGSGAVGLEALSRGAASVLLVESDMRAAAVIRASPTPVPVVRAAAVIRASPTPVAVVRAAAVIPAVAGIMANH